MVRVGLCNMSLGLWCAGVELGGGGRWRGEGQVETGHADGPGAEKGGREVWTEGPEHRRTSRAEVLRRNRAAHGGITEVASRRIKSVQEAWPSDRQKIELDHNALGLGGSL